MISTGAQIRAARALIGLHQSELAQRAGLHANAVKYWEARMVPPGRPPDAIERIEHALKALGVETFADPAPGVRLSWKDNSRGTLKEKPRR